MRLDFFEQPQCLNFSHDSLSRIKAIHPSEPLWCCVVDRRAGGEDIDLWELMTLSHRIIIEIVRRCDFDAA